MSNKNNMVLNIPYATVAELMKTKRSNILGNAVFLKEAEKKGAGMMTSCADNAVEDIVALMACPALAARIYIVEEDDSYTSTHLVSDSRGKMTFISKDTKGYKATGLMDRKAALSELVSRIDGGAPVCDVRAVFELPKPDFYILLAAVDLYARKRMLSSLGHTPPELSFDSNELLYILKEGLACTDPRWLVPFMNQVIPYSSSAPHEDMVVAALQRLSDMKLINKNSLTGAGMLFALSFYRRICLIGVEIVGAKEDSSLAGQYSAFLRGDRMLWFVDASMVTDELVTVVSIRMEEGENIINEYFRSEGIPAEVRHTPKLQPKLDSGMQPTIQRPNFCSVCGKPLSPNSRFCGRCGAELL